MRIKAYRNLPQHILNTLDSWSEADPGYDIYYEKNSPSGKACFFAALKPSAASSGSNDVIGFLSLLWIPGETESEVTAYVKPSSRHKGVFSALLQRAKASAGRLGITHLYTATATPGRLPYSHSELLMTLVPDESARKEALPTQTEIQKTISENDVFFYIDDKLGNRACECHITTPDKDSPDDVSHTSCLWGVWTEPAQRNMGLATGLVNHVVLWHSRNFPCTPLVLQVSSRNEAAIRIYEKIGFRETDSIKYYSL